MAASAVKEKTIVAFMLAGNRLVWTRGRSWCGTLNTDEPALTIENSIEGSATTLYPWIDQDGLSSAKRSKVAAKLDTNARLAHGYLSVRVRTLR